jgi:hypothetical protein
MTVAESLTQPQYNVRSVDQQNQTLVPSWAFPMSDIHYDPCQIVIIGIVHDAIRKDFDPSTDKISRSNRENTTYRVMQRH